MDEPMVKLLVEYEMPVDIAKQMMDGGLARLGSVAVRDHEQIVMHIKESGPAFEASAREHLKRAAAAANSKEKVVLVVIGTFAVAGAGFAGWKWWKNRKAIAIAEELTTATTSYLQAVSCGAVGPSEVSRLLSALNAAHGADGNHVVEVSGQGASALSALVSDYTRVVVETHGGDEPVVADGLAPVLDLRARLAVQNEVLRRSG